MHCFKVISMARFIWCLIVVCLWGMERGRCSKEVLKNISKGFAGVLEECKKEQSTGDHIMKDFFNFWREEYELVNREFGCMILCIGQKLDLLDENMKVHHGNAEEFAQKHGADGDVAKQLVTIVHECEKAHESIEDHCARILESAKCFRTRIHELNWSPSMSEIMEEMLNAL